MLGIGGVFGASDVAPDPDALQALRPPELPCPHTVAEAPRPVDFTRATELTPEVEAAAQRERASSAP